jgi:hypothetical protein
MAQDPESGRPVQVRSEIFDESTSPDDRQRVESDVDQCFLEIENCFSVGDTRSRSDVTRMQRRDEDDMSGGGTAERLQRGFAQLLLVRCTGIDNCCWPIRTRVRPAQAIEVRGQGASRSDVVVRHRSPLHIDPRPSLQRVRFVLNVFAGMHIQESNDRITPASILRRSVGLQCISSITPQ